MRSSSENNICFLANYTKTYFFDSIAKELQKHGFTVSWIVVNKKLFDYLRERYKGDDLLFINKKYIDIPADKIGEYKLHELIYGDRTLKHIQEKGLRYLINIQRPIYDFLKGKRIRIVIGEINWAHEIMVHRIISQRPELNCTFLNPHTVRIPNGRFAFFVDEFQTKILQRGNGEGPVEDATPTIKVEKPEYLTLNDRIVRDSRSLKARLLKIKRFISAENIDKNDPTLIGERWTRFKVRCREELNKELYRFVKIVSLSEVGSKPFIFVALHKQPEASIDVLGRYYEDQYQNIVNIWRIAPDDWLLLVKEHTNAIGDRGRSFYRKLSKLRNLYFLREDTDSHEAIKKSRLVVTVSGTVAYEAALLGKSAVTLAPTFFSRVPNCRRICPDDLRKAQDIYDITVDSVSDTSDLESFVLHNSFLGIISDPISDARSMGPENIRNVATAIMHVTE